VWAADLPENLAASQQYLRDFTTVAKKCSTVEDLVRGMLALHGERDQPHRPVNTRPPGMLRQRRAGGSTLPVRSVFRRLGR
jgi:hypothetical protein